MVRYFSIVSSPLFVQLILSLGFSSAIDAFASDPQAAPIEVSGFCRVPMPTSSDSKQSADGLLTGKGNNCLPGPRLLPGAVVWRMFDELEFRVRVATDPSLIGLDIFMGNASAKELRLNATKPVVTFQLSDDSLKAEGSVMAYFCTSPEPSKLVADFVIRHKDINDKMIAYPFQGEVAIWDSGERIAAGTYSNYLSPNIRIDTQIYLDVPKGVSQPSGIAYPESARVEFYIDNQQIHASILSTGLVSTVTTKDISIGNSKILKGATLQFQTATQERNGLVKLDALVVAGLAGEKFEFQGVVASWPWVNLPATSCRRLN